MDTEKLPRLKLVNRYVKYWEQCWDPRICADIPFDGTKCIGFHACVRIIEDKGSFYIEAEVNGQAARYEIANACIPTFSVGIGHLDVCLSNVTIVDGQLKSIDLTVKACVGGDIGPIHLGQCWDLFNQHIQFSVITAADIEGISGARGIDKAFKFVVTPRASSPSSGESHCRCM
jgi:hypothetical protein